MKVLNINNIKTAAFVTMLTASATGCKQSAHYTPLARECVQPKTTILVDSLHQEGKKIIDNEDFVFLGCDTLPLNKDFATNPAGLFKSANLTLRDNFNDKVVTSQGEPRVYTHPDRIGVTQDINALDLYVNKQAVVSANEFYTLGSDSKTVYVPVQYYGQINPNIPPIL